MRRRPVVLVRVIAIAACGSLMGVSAQPAFGYSPEKAGFGVRIGRDVFPYRIVSVFVLPGEQIRIEIVNAPIRSAFDARPAADPSENGVLTPEAADRWVWTAPGTARLCGLDIIRLNTSDSIHVNLFVMVPFESLRGETLNGYQIGTYPKTALRGLDIYRPPRGFIEVTPELEGIPLSPHFRMHQFLSKQESGYPKYLVLSERLLLKLEVTLEATNAGGHPCETFHVMSGYRTPFYNQAIGNVKYSRHLWGGAADIFIDEDPRDGYMDDLNGDGRSDFRDAAVLYEIVDGLYGRPFYAKLIGGLARYRRTSSHGPFVHLDVRGTHTRWGD